MLENELDNLFPRHSQNVLRCLFVDGRGREIGRPFCNVVFALELGAQKAIDYPGFSLDPEELSRKQRQT